MDITIEVMLPARGTTDWTADTHPRYRIGSVVAVYSDRKRPDVVGMAITGYIHVTNVPIISYLPIERVLQVSCANVQQKRAWFFQWQRIPLAVRNALLTDRQVEVGFLQARAWLRNQDESRDLTDADLA